MGCSDGSKTGVGSSKASRFRRRQSIIGIWIGVVRSRINARKGRDFGTICGQKLGMARQIVGPMSRQGAPSLGPKGVVQTSDDGGLAVAVAPGKLCGPHGDELRQIALSHISRRLNWSCGPFRQRVSGTRRPLLSLRRSLWFGRSAGVGRKVQGHLRIGRTMREGGMAGWVRGLTWSSGWQASCMSRAARVLASPLWQ